MRRLVSIALLTSLIDHVFKDINAVYEPRDDLQIFKSDQYSNFKKHRLMLTHNGFKYEMEK